MDPWRRGRRGLGGWRVHARSKMGHVAHFARGEDLSNRKGGTYHLFRPRFSDGSIVAQRGVLHPEALGIGFARSLGEVLVNASVGEGGFQLGVLVTPSYPDGVGEGWILRGIVYPARFLGSSSVLFWTVSGSIEGFFVRFWTPPFRSS